jgi:hypothetical protein
MIVEMLSGESVAGEGARPLEHTAILEVLTGVRPVSNVFVSGSPHAPCEVAGELLVVGTERTVFACVAKARRWLVLLVAPPSMSVALGWTLLRHVAMAADGA